MRLFLLFMALLLLTGCEKNDSTAVEPFAGKTYGKIPEMTAAYAEQEIRLPFKKGEIDLQPFYISLPNCYFFSRTFNRITCYNMDTGDIRSFTDPEISVHNFLVTEDSIYLNDGNKGKVLKLAFDLKHTSNFLGQKNEDAFHSGHGLSITRKGIFQYNYDHPLITQFSLEGKKLLALEMPTADLLGIESLEKGNILLFYPDRIIMFTPEGKLANELKLRCDSFLVYPDKGIYVLSEGTIYFYDPSFSLKRKYKLGNLSITRLKRAKTQALYFATKSSVYHLLINGQTQKIPIAPARELKDFLPTYDNHFIVHDENGLHLYSASGRIVKEYEPLFHYFDFYFFKDRRSNYYMADSNTQILRVTNEATYSIVENIMYNSQSFSRDSNIVFDSAGNIFFVNRVGGNIEKITTKFMNKQFEGTGLTTALPFSRYSRIVEGPDHSIYLFSKERQAILKYDREGQNVFRLGNLDETRKDNSIFKQAETIAVDNLSNLYVFDSKACCLLSFDRFGDFVNRHDLPPNMDPDLSMLFDRYNRLWLSSGTGLQIYDPSAGRFHSLHAGDPLLPFDSFYISQERELFFLSSDEQGPLLRSMRTEDPYTKGMNAYQAHRFKEAATFFEKASAFLPEDPALVFYLANCYVLLNRKSDALSMLKNKRSLAIGIELEADWKDLLSQLEDTP